MQHLLQLGQLMLAVVIVWHRSKGTELQYVRT